MYIARERARWTAEKGEERERERERAGEEKRRVGVAKMAPPRVAVGREVGGREVENVLSSRRKGKR